MQGAVGGVLQMCAHGAHARQTQAPLADVSFVDPELRPLAADMLRSIRSAPPPSFAQLAALRAGDGPPPLSSPHFEKRVVPGPPGAPDVGVYVINAEAGARRPAILHIHGGGFMLGSARDSVARLQAVAAELGCVVVTVEYRLAPETGFEGITADTCAAFEWLHSQAQALGVDPRRVAVMGESAGGGLAALLALAARDRGGPPLVFQMLVYPVLDDRTGTTVYPPSPIGLLGWTAEYNRLGWRAFLGRTPAGPDVPVQAVPARHADLAGLPPTFIGVGGVDLLVDEDITYAKRLIDAHVPTELMVIPGVFHGFDVAAPGSRVAKAFRMARLEALKRAFSAA